jgi:predicted transcriptional regulator
MNALLKTDPSGISNLAKKTANNNHRMRDINIGLVPEIA